MIVAEFFQKNDMICGFKVYGHANYADSGNDIVCASISSAVQLTANTISEIFRFNAEITESNNVITLKSVDYCDSVFQGVLKGFRFHVKLLSQQFSKNVKIKITEV